MLQPGQKRTNFTLPDADMQAVELASFLGKKRIVLYFYPRDNTPGCTMQAGRVLRPRGRVRTAATA
jgi:peroxiredoxin